MNDKQKKLLLLGGSSYLLPVIREAHALGLYVVTCDYLPDNIAHRYSDEYRNVSILDRDAVLETARELGISGVMSFACDPGVVTAAYVAEKLSLPSPGSYEATCILQDKGRFRAFLRDNSFTVPWAKRYTEIGEALADALFFPWPVIVKPTDSAGSKGVTRVDDTAGLEAAIEHAKLGRGGEKPTMVILNTKKGCGVKWIEDLGAANHNTNISEEQAQAAIAEIRGEV